jgi:hypothetical protein
MIAYRREVLGSVEGGTRGTLDEAIRGLERKRKVHVMGGADPLIRLIRGAWDLYRGNPASGELVMFASWDELKAAAQGQKDGPPGDPALQVPVRLIKDRDRRVLQMCHQLEACVESHRAHSEDESRKVVWSKVEIGSGLGFAEGLGPRSRVGSAFATRSKNQRLQSTSCRRPAPGRSRAMEDRFAV